MHFHKAQEKPKLWGSFQDRQYSIWRNLEDIYGCDHESEVLIMPLFWGLPCWDYSKFGNHGVNHGASFRNGSLGFDESNDYVDCGEGLDEIESDSTFSIGFWIQRSNDDFYQRIISHGKDANEHVQIIMNDGTLGVIGWEVGTPTLNEIKGATSEADKLDKDTWYHIVFVCDSGSILYINGVSKTLVNTEGKGNPSGNFLLGKDAGGASYFDGLIGETRVSNAVRTVDQIALFHDRPWDLYRRVGRPFWSIPATGDIDETLRLISLSLNISETDLQVYKDLEKQIDLTLSFIETDIQSYKDLNNLINITSLISLIDIQDFIEDVIINLISILSETDLLAYAELDKEVLINTSVVLSDIQAYKDLVNILTTMSVSKTDLQAFKDIINVNLSSSISVTDILYSMESRTVSILCTVSELDFFPGLESATRKSFVLTGRINEYVLTDRIRDYVLMSRIKEYELTGRNKNYYLS